MPPKQSSSSYSHPSRDSTSRDALGSSKTKATTSSSSKAPARDAVLHGVVIPDDYKWDDLQTETEALRKKRRANPSNDTRSSDPTPAAPSTRQRASSTQVKSSAQLPPKRQSLNDNAEWQVTRCALLARLEVLLPE